MSTYHWYFANQIGPIEFGCCRIESSDGEWQRDGKIIKYRPTFALREREPGVAIGWVGTSNHYVFLIGITKGKNCV